MIEFSGQLSSRASRRFRQKSFLFTLKIFLATLSLMFPILLYISIWMDNYYFLILFLILIIALPFVSCSTKSQKEWRTYEPHRIYIDDGLMVCVSQKAEDIRNLNDVKCVYDFGDYYDIVFRFGRVSDMYICCKELLVAGTVEEFESLFPCIIRKTE